MTSFISSSCAMLHFIKKCVASWWGGACTRMAASTEHAGVVFVRSVEAEELLTISLRFNGKNHKLQRSKEEVVGKALKRMCLTASKGGKRKKKWTINGANCDPIEAHLICEATSAEVAEHTSNSLAWRHGNVLVIGGSSYSIEVNVPAVLSLKVSQCIMTHHPVVPQVELDFAELSRCKWVWRWSRQPSSGHDHDKCVSEHEDSIVLSTSYVYWPTEEDFGRQLTVECIPVGTDEREGQSVVIATNPVEKGPSPTAVAKRHLHTRTHLPGDQFRVVSYNILADPYTSTAYASQVLYPYCKVDALSVEYRQSLVVQELLGYSADVMCLQEVGASCYKWFLLPAMHQKGYDGCFQAKVGAVPEGEAILFSSSKFELVSTEFAALKEFLQTDPSCADLLEALRKAPDVLQTISSRHTIVLLAFLRRLEKPDHFLCIANTHLYFHPTSDHIRLLQVKVCLRYLRVAIKKFVQQLHSHDPAQQPKVAVIFGGDFNSCPCTAAVELMVKGSVSKHHQDWTKHNLPEPPECTCGSIMRLVGHCGEETKEQGAASRRALGETEHFESTSKSDRKAATFEGLDLQHGFHLQSACGIPQYTNYTYVYSGVLDYIFIDTDHLQVERVIPLPSLEEVTEFVALPSIHFPSDHLALVCDLRWK